MLIAFLRGVGRGYGPNWRGMILKRTNPETDSLFEKARLLYTANCPAVKYTTHPYKVFRWPTGEMLTIRHMYDPEDYNAVHGSEIGFLAWDELTNWPTPEVYLKCMSLLRSSHPEVSKMMQVWSTSNPGGNGHNWVLKRWKLHITGMDKTIIYDDDDAKEMARWSNDPLVNVKSRPRISIFLDVRQNDIFMKANPTYLADLARQAPNDAVRRAWIDGDWSVVAGGIFDDVWDARHHVVEPFPIPKTWKIDRSFDWGSSTPFSVMWYAESDGSDYVDAQGRWRSSVAGDIFVIHEWYGTNGQANTGLRLTAGQVAEGIVEREMDWGIHQRVIPGPADNAIHSEVMTGHNIATDMGSDIRLEDGTIVHGVHWTRSDKNAGARATGWSMIRDRLSRSLPDPEAKSPRELPGLFFFNRLKYCLEQVPVTPRDEKSPEDIPKKGEFHIQDTLRYRIMSDGRSMSTGSTVGMH
jgi:hypothetical protein